MKATASLLALTLGAALPGCATSAAFPRAPTGLRIGAVSEASTFEKREAASKPATFDNPEQTNAAKRRKTAFWTGVGLAAFGAVGSLGFGIGGRVVQAQLANGYDDESLTRGDEDRLETTGRVMNGLTIGSVSVGLLGVALLSIAYALDHSRCGDLPPKRETCPTDRPKTATSGSTAGQ